MLLRCQLVQNYIDVSQLHELSCIVAKCALFSEKESAQTFFIHFRDEFPMILVGNKSDLEHERTVSKLKVMLFCQDGPPSKSLETIPWEKRAEYEALRLLGSGSSDCL